MTKKPSADPRQALRGALARVDELVLEDGSSALRTAWGALVTALDLGPAPATRECPACGNECMREATTCGFCWRALVPVAGPN